jgi:hypothetical protein
MSQKGKELKFHVPNHPLAEVFGFPTTNQTTEAQRHRKAKLCPFNNHVPNCTKDKANNPLGVCSIYEGESPAITCPIRFRERWIIAEHAASFFFGSDLSWTSLTEVPLKDCHGKEAGNIDIVLVAYDDAGRLISYGALEIQAVYISGNVRKPFEHYMADPVNHSSMSWRGQPNSPRPDYLSSSRKRLVPQLLFKGGILHAWNRKTAVAMQTSFYNTLPLLAQVKPSEGEIAWLLYGLRHDQNQDRFLLELNKTIYTRFTEAMEQISKPAPGDEAGFVAELQYRLDRKLENNHPPETSTLDLEL